MSDEEFPEGQVVADLIYGRGERTRTTAPEPALLPQLAAYLCHDFTIPQVLEGARLYGKSGGIAPPWLPLWEAVVWSVASRADLIAYLTDFTDFNRDYLGIVCALVNEDAGLAQQLFASPLNIGPEYSAAAGAARLAPLLSKDQVLMLLDDPACAPDMLDAESVRSLLSAASMHGLTLAPDWTEAALVGEGSEFAPSRQAHLLPFLPPDVSPKVADSLAEEINGLHMPVDMRALWISRVAPFVSGGAVWDTAALIDEYDDPVWQSHIQWLLGAPWPARPWEDVFRAHPEWKAFENISRPHETTADAPDHINERWAGAEMAMVEMESASPPPPPPEPEPEPEPGRSRGIDEVFESSKYRSEVPSPDLRDGVVPPLAVSPEPQTERRLQADVLLEDTLEEVSAFVADQVHLIDVSIGRGARTRADARFDESVFDETDADWLVLPVWFHAGTQKYRDKIRLPRDRSRNSTTCSFSFTAPPGGRVLARIHLMRPGGGRLLQSAVFAGDVVDTVADAKSYAPAFQLSVDVLAGDLQDPPVESGGVALITNENSALAESDGSLVEIDVSMLQNDLNQLVHEIETAADRQDVDERAAAKKLVALAIAGQRLRGQFDAALKKYKEASPLQIISLRPGDVLPLELIYDGPALGLNSQICATWRQALKDGHCGNCAGSGPDADPAPARVCPMRFWSMAKVIERRTADAHGGPFRVRAERSAGRPYLRAIRGVVVGASGRVSAADVEHVRMLAEDEFGVAAKKAENWSKWCEVIHDEHPELLVVMPHNKSVMSGLSSALMVGEPADDTITAPPEAALLAGGVTEEHVQLTEDNPGPVVFLLGCNTQFEAGRLSGFAGEFREKGAAVTIGTLGELRADQAPRAAEFLIRQISQRGSQASSMGEVLLETRRHLLSEGMIMALLLVANGDADWLLPGRST
jgi:hypothetical protein